MSKYGQKKYWDKRYTAEQNVVFDWLKDYSDLKAIITECCSSKDISILNLGCGNGILQENMFDDGYINIHNIDISEVCIEKMIARQGDRAGLVYKVMDCIDLQYPDESFDLVIDKSTIDAMFCGEDGYLNVARTLGEVQRVLKPGGVYLVISYGFPEDRVFHFERDHLDFQINQFAFPVPDIQQVQVYAYILRKGNLAMEKYKDNYKTVIDELMAEEEKEKRKNPHLYVQK